MRYFKRFADFCTGFALFTMALYLFRKFMSADFPEEIEGIKEKLKFFFDKDTEVSRLLMLMMVMLLALSLAASCLLKRFPHIAAVFAVPPLALAMDMISSERIDEYPMLYVILPVMGILGVLFEALRRDREDGKCRGSVSSALISLLTSAFCFYVWFRWNQISDLEKEAVYELNFFDAEIYRNSPYMNMKSLLIFAMVYFAIAVLMLVLRDVYFISAPVSAIPLIILIYRWNAETLIVHPEVVVTLSAVVFAVSLVCTLSGTAKVKAKENPQKSLE